MHFLLEGIPRSYIKCKCADDYWLSDRKQKWHRHWYDWLQHIKLTLYHYIFIIIIKFNHVNLWMKCTWNENLPLSQVKANCIEFPPTPQKASTMRSDRHRSAMCSAIFSGVTENQPSETTIIITWALSIWCKNWCLDLSCCLHLTIKLVDNDIL